MKRFIVLLVSVLIAAPGIAFAADTADNPKSDEPTYDLTLYLWGTSVAGQVDTDRGEFDTHISFSDLLKNLNFAAMLRGRAQFGKFSIVSDLEYFDLESDRESTTLRFGPRGNIKVPVSGKAELNQWIVELNGGYQIFNLKGPFSAGPSDERGTIGELYAGGRYVALKPVLDWEVGPFSDKTGEWERWIDAVVGARVGIDLSKTVVLGIQGDVGGFNIGNSSKFAWSQITSLSWHFSDSLILSLGYKFLDVKKDHGDNQIDIQLRGPFAAMTARF